MTETFAWLSAVSAFVVLAALLALLGRRLLMHRLSSARQLRRLALFPERNPEPVLSVSFDGTLRYANPSALALAERLSPGGGGATALLPADLSTHIAHQLNTGFTDERWEYLLHTSVLRCSLHCIEDHGVCHVYLKDLTAQHIARSLLDHHALHDQLTGLPNQRALRERLDAALAAGKSANLLLLHPDRFRELLETLGQASADILLRAMAARLVDMRDSLPACTVHRFEGALFALLCTDTESPDSAPERLAARLGEMMTPAFEVEGHELYFSLSMASSRAPRDGSDAASLLRRADVALQHAKREGGGIHMAYHAELDARALSRLELEHQLTHAAQRGELSLRYQPQYAIADGQMVGVEALVRWHHPVLGDIPLSEFIPLAESSGAIVGIGAWVLRTACERARAWQQRGLPPVVVAVNLSPRHFNLPGLPGDIRACLADTGLDPQWLEIEITESAAMHDIDHACGILHALKSLGIKLALDDFGTGHSALAWLRRLPVDKLKLDQSFVRDMERDSANAAIVRAMVALGRDLGIAILAEGVEKIEQLAMLRTMRCDEVQGYLFSEPVDEAALIRLIETPPPSPVSRLRTIGGTVVEHPASRLHSLRP